MVDDDRKQSDDNPNFRDKSGRFMPGNPGSPGRPKGSRHALEEDFVATLQNEFRKRGALAIAQLESKELCDIVTKVLPKESRIDLGDTFTDLLARAADVVSKRRG
jgi:hypothetical protein